MMKRWLVMSLLALGAVGFVTGCCSSKGDCGDRAQCPMKQQKCVKKAACSKCKTECAVPGDCKQANCPKCGDVLVVEEGELLVVPAPEAPAAN